MISPLTLLTYAGLAFQGMNPSQSKELDQNLEMPRLCKLNNMRAPHHLSLLQGSGPICLKTNLPNPLCSAKPEINSRVDQENDGLYHTIVDEMTLHEIKFRVVELSKTFGSETANNIGHATLQNIVKTEASLPYDYGTMDFHKERKSRPLTKTEVCQQKMLQAESIIEFLEQHHIIDKIGQQLPCNPIIIDAYAGYGAFGEAMRQYRPDATVFEIEVEPQASADADFCGFDNTHYITTSFDADLLETMLENQKVDLLFSSAPAISSSASIKNLLEILLKNLSPKGQFVITVPMNGLFVNLLAASRLDQKTTDTSSVHELFLKALEKHFDTRYFHPSRESGFPATHTPMIIAGVRL